MAVYFVYRCHYGTPSEKHVRRFEYDTILDWAKAVFKQLPGDKDGWDYAKELLGGLHVYSFGHLFALDDELFPKLDPPETMEDVYGWFERMYDPRTAHGPHHLQIMTDDDEQDMAVYVFDDHYPHDTTGNADFCLIEGW